MISQITRQGRVPELKKHVAAIHSSSKLTLVQRKIANALLYNAYKHLLDHESHQIHVTDLCELIGYHSKDFQTIKNSLMALISAVVEWNVIDKLREEKRGIWNASAIIADASIDGPICTYSYSPKMRELLHRPELYGQLNMEVLSRFKSTYGLALYENCIRYKNVHKTPWFTIDVFRSLMGVEENKYRAYKDFKKRVLDKAIDEVNKHAPINVVVDVKKQGRKTIALQFSIQQKQVEIQSEISGNDDIRIKLQNDFGISSKEITTLLSTYDESFVLEKITIVESSRAFQQGKIANLAKYLGSALENDFQAPKASYDRVRDKQVEAVKDENLRKQREKKMLEYRKYQDKSFLELFENMPVKEKKPILTAFEEHMQTSIYIDLFSKEGLSNVLVADNFCNFVRSKKYDWAQDIMVFDDFCNQTERS